MFQIILILTGAWLIVLNYLISKSEPKVIYKVSSKFFKKIEVKQISKQTVGLFIDNQLQGINTDSEYITSTYWHKIAQRAQERLQKKDTTILLLGLGAGTVPQLIHNSNKQVNFCIIEIDTAVLEISQRYFNLNQIKANSTIVIGDIQKIINGSALPNESYDIIIVDIFAGDKTLINPITANKKTFEFLKKYSNQDTFLIINRPIHTPKARNLTRDSLAELSYLLQPISSDDVIDKQGFKNRIITAKFKSSH